MLFSLLKHYLEFYIIYTALKVSRSLYCFTTSIFHGVENYFPRLWGTGISDAIFMSSLCGVRVCVNNFSSKTTRPRDMLVFKKIPYLSRMKTCSRHANLYVRLFARDITREVPPPKVSKCQHFITIFSVTIAGISLISCIYVLGQK